jgi:hypothetical protein
MLSDYLLATCFVKCCTVSFICSGIELIICFLYILFFLSRTSAELAKKQKRPHEGSNGRDFKKWWSGRFGMIKNLISHYFSYVPNQ